MAPGGRGKALRKLPKSGGAALMNFGRSYFLKKPRMGNRERFKAGSETAPIRHLLDEPLISSMGFMARDDLEALQLVCVKLYALVEHHFPHYPLRSVHSFTLSSTKRESSRMKIVCIPKSGVTSAWNGTSHNKIIQSDEDPHLWLRNCAIWSLKFENFLFTDSVLDAFADVEMCLVNFVLVEYEVTRTIKSLSVGDMLVKLFEIPYFKKCNGAVFRFDENTETLRPSISTLLNLPLSTLVIDYEDFFLDRDHLHNIVSWLNGEGFSGAPVANSANARAKSLSLSLRNMDTSEEELRATIIKLKEDFVKAEHKRQWIIDTDFEADDDLAEQLSNKHIGQSMLVSAGAEKPLRITRE